MDRRMDMISGGWFLRVAWIFVRQQLKKQQWNVFFSKSNIGLIIKLP